MSPRIDEYLKRFYNSQQVFHQAGVETFEIHSAGLAELLRRN